MAPQCGQAANDRPDSYQKMERGLPSGTLLVRVPRPAAASDGRGWHNAQGKGAYDRDDSYQKATGFPSGVHLPQSSSCSRFTAAQAGFFDLSQSGERPLR
jgi:hypothetical protein